MVVLEILIYVFFAWTMYTCAKKSYRVNPNREKLDKYICWYLIFFTFISAVRWNVGVDCVSYMQIFDKGKVREENTEPLWSALVLFLHNLNAHFIIGMGITAFVQIYFVTKLAFKYRYILIFLPIALFGGAYYLDWCNAVRQMMAAAIFVYSTQYILSRRLIPYFFCVFVASLIHHSAQMLFVVYVISFIDSEIISISDKKNLTIGVFLFCFILGMTPQFKNFLGLFNFILDFFGGSYEYVGDTINRTIVEGKNDALNFGLMQFSYFVTAFSIIWFGPKLKKEYREQFPYYDIWWFFAFIYSCGYFLVCNVNFMFIRPFNYFQPFQLLMISLLLFFLYEKRQKKKFRLIVLVIWSNIFWNIIKNFGVDNYESVTYKLFLFHDLYKDWKF